MDFDLEIISPEKQVFGDKVRMVTVPTPKGTVGVLANHCALFSVLLEGEIKIKTIRDTDQYYAIGGGYLEVTRHKTTILVSRALNADEINEAEIKKAQALAKEALSRKVKGEELKQAQAILRRSLIEFKVLKRRRSTRV